MLQCYYYLKAKLRQNKSDNNQSFSLPVSLRGASGLLHNSLTRKFLAISISLNHETTQFVQTWYIYYLYRAQRLNQVLDQNTDNNLSLSAIEKTKDFFNLDIPVINETIETIVFPSTRKKLIKIIIINFSESSKLFR